MDSHELDPVALVVGLLFTFAGLAVLADRLWEDVDVTTITGVGVAVVGLVLAGAIIARYLTTNEDAG